MTDNQCPPAHRSSCRRVKLSSTTSCANLIWQALNSNWNGASSCRPILQVSSVRRANLSVVKLASSPGDFPTGAEPRPRRDRNQPVNIWTAAFELALSLLTPLIYKEEATSRQEARLIRPPPQSCPESSRSNACIVFILGTGKSPLFGSGVETLTREEIVNIR